MLESASLEQEQERVVGFSLEDSGDTHILRQLIIRVNPSKQ